MDTHTNMGDSSKMSVFSSRLGTGNGLLKPNRRPRPLRANTRHFNNEYGPESCDLQINTFYQAPVGEENWAIKHMNLRS